MLPQNHFSFRPESWFHHLEEWMWLLWYGLGYWVSLTKYWSVLKGFWFFFLSRLADASWMHREAKSVFSFVLRDFMHVNRQRLSLFIHLTNWCWCFLNLWSAAMWSSTRWLAQCCTSSTPIFPCCLARDETFCAFICTNYIDSSNAIQI